MTQHFLGEGQEMPEAECQNCGSVHDMASAVNEDAVPKPGDASICILCGHLSVFADDFSLRDPTNEEIKKYAGDSRIVAAMTALHRVKSETLTLLSQRKKK